MATVRLVIVLLVLGAMALLALQNMTPALPLVFLGINFQPLPLAVWLLGAVGLGALTTLVLTGLLGSTGGGGGSRTNAYKYQPQPFYEPDSGPGSPPGNGPSPAPPPQNNRAGRWAGGFQNRSTGFAQATPRPAAAATAAAAGGGEWQAWTSLQSPAQWDNWEALENAPRPENAPTPGRSTGWFGGQKKVAQEQRVNESLEELSGNWGDVDRHPYRAPGASPVDDSLDDINQGWDGYDDGPDAYSQRDFEAPQAPQQVYRDGSVYSYSYRDRNAAGQRDNIYAPPDDPENYYTDDDPEVSATYYPPYDDGINPGQGPGSEATFTAAAPDEDLGEPAIAEDGVVDADYRVIIPPYSPPAAEPAHPSDPDDDDWDEADDALTP
ncbi:MAG: hypothetical protein ACFCVD_11700 [Nodosilinea sp.]